MITLCLMGAFLSCIAWCRFKSSLNDSIETLSHLLEISRGKLFQKTTPRYEKLRSKKLLDGTFIKVNKC